MAFPSLRSCGCLALLAVFSIGCGSSGTTVTGKVTCSGKPVVGALLFSPSGSGPENKAEPVPVQINADGTYTATLHSIGPYRVVVMPSDIKYPAPPGEEYPCDLTPMSKTLTAGANEWVIDLSAKK